MISTRKRWILAAGGAVIAAATGLFVAGSIAAQRFDPYIREQAILYLQDRFDADVELTALKVRLPGVSPLRLLMSKGRGSIARAEATGLVVRRRDGGASISPQPPLFTLQRCTFEVDLGTLWTDAKRVKSVKLEGMQIRIPPRSKASKKTARAADRAARARDSVVIDRVEIHDATLAILPKDPNKIPLEFDLHRVVLESAGLDVAMTYDAELTNAKPPGRIRSKGTFGPWDAEDPGDTPLAGEYTFDKADLGVFRGIAGTLYSTGKFDGSLSSIHARGQALVPNFRLKQAGNPVPLNVNFEVQVDGTNGDTLLKPVRARLGSAEFTTSGGIIKHEAAQRRAIQLEVSMPKGNLADLLRLAMKGPTFMEGTIALKTKIDIPPLSGKVREKLVLDGTFQISGGKFLRSTIQDQIDGLSRRGQGQPKNGEIDEVVSEMSGKFHMQDEAIQFQTLSFAVPGAHVAIAGGYDMDADALDFHGTLRLQAKVSQTMTGWKRLALKPIDPIFAKDGAGTVLKIQIVGPASGPKFGRDRGSPGA
jgi:hypothetical protein